MRNDLMNTRLSMRSVRTLTRQQNNARGKFKLAESVSESLKSFREIESCFPQSDLGFECLTLATRLFTQSSDRKQVIRFGKRALKILTTNVTKNIPCFGTTCSAVLTHHSNGITCNVFHNSSIYIAYGLHLLAAACLDLKSLDDAFYYLNLADNYLNGLEDNCCSGDCVLRVIIGIQFQMFRVKVIMNYFGEAVVHMKKILEVKERMLEEDCVELGEANMYVCVSYCTVMNVKMALPYCLKALEIRMKHLECDSVEVAETRSTLEYIYMGLGEYDKADEQKLLWESVLDQKNVPFGPKSLIREGRYQEAISILEGVVSHDGMEKESLALAFIFMADAFCKLRKFAIAKKHLGTARGLLEKNDLCQNLVALLFGEMSNVYVEMNDFETASSLTRRVLAISELPKGIRSESSTRLFSLTFLAAKHVDGMIKAFKEIEACCEEPELALGCWKIASELFSQGRSPEEVISFGNRALGIFIANDNTNNPCFGKTFSKASIGIGKTCTSCTRYHKLSLYIACLCNLLASACLKLKRYDESLSYLNWANRNLSKLEEDDDSSCGSNCVLQALANTQKELFNVKAEMGRFEEVVLHLRKNVDIQEKIMEAGSIELGEAYEFVSGAYYKLMNFEEALQFYLKALEIHTRHSGCNSLEVAKMMKHLAVLYNELGGYEKALEQNKLSRNILKKATPISPVLLEAETDLGKILIGLGKYEEAVDVLQGVISYADAEVGTQASAYVTMARAFCYLEKFADAKKCMRTAQRILEKKEMSHVDVAIGFKDMSKLYEKMNDFEKAISLLRRVLAMPGIPRKLLAQSSARVFSLISLHFKVKRGIPYMEDVVEKLKGSLGTRHCEVGYGYRNLGTAYFKAGQKELAGKSIVKAKEIMDVTHGPRHLDSLKTSQMLAEAYAAMRRFDEAIEIQAEVVEGLKVLEPCEQELLNIAVKLFNKMKDSLAESRIGASQSKCDDDLSAKISNCGVSDDDKVLK